MAMTIQGSIFLASSSSSSSSSFWDCPFLALDAEIPAPHRLLSEVESERFEIGMWAVLETPAELEPGFVVLVG